MHDGYVRAELPLEDARQQHRVRRVVLDDEHAELALGELTRAVDALLMEIRRALQRLEHLHLVPGLREGREDRRVDLAVSAQVHVRHAGDHDRHRIGTDAPYPSDQRQAVHARHAQVGHEDREGALSNELQRLLGARRARDAEAVTLEGAPERAREHRLVVYEQDRPVRRGGLGAER